MSYCGRVFALLLLASVAIATVPAHQLGGAAPAPKAPVGCHDHSPDPVPEPSSHTCCQAGHESAILQASLMAPPLFIQVSRLSQFNLPASPIRLSSVGVLTLPATPPVRVPLLI
jgi:hypothetical protein